MRDRVWFLRRGNALLPRWAPVAQGSDEYARLTVALRVPGGWLVFARNARLPEFRGPCVGCGRWEHYEMWDGARCQMCRPVTGNG